MPVIHLLLAVDVAAKMAGHPKLGMMGTRAGMQGRFHGALTEAEVLMRQCRHGHEGRRHPRPTALISVRLAKP